MTRAGYCIRRTSLPISCGRVQDVVHGWMGMVGSVFCRTLSFRGCFHIHTPPAGFLYNDIPFLICLVGRRWEVCERIGVGGKAMNIGVMPQLSKELSL